MKKNNFIKLCIIIVIICNLILIIFEIVSYGHNNIIIFYNKPIYYWISIIIFICYISLEFINERITNKILNIFLFICNFCLLILLLFLITFNLSSLVTVETNIFEQQDIIFTSIFFDIHHIYSQKELLIAFTDEYEWLSKIKANLPIEKKLKIIGDANKIVEVKKIAANYVRYENTNIFEKIQNYYLLYSTKPEIGIICVVSSISVFCCLVNFFMYKEISSLAYIIEKVTRSLSQLIRIEQVFLEQININSELKNRTIILLEFLLKELEKLVNK